MSETQITIEYMNLMRIVIIKIVFKKGLFNYFIHSNINFF